ncbi:unnamed protein product [Durusdinium trenchii]|uniref:Uncharacterized protein n=1 Tax=Durusdinium trenchii TaxID=1381693 RepID=A0ABP0I2T1_9DINO
MRRSDLLALIKDAPHRLIPRCVITQSSGKQRIIDSADQGGQTMYSADFNKLVLCSPLRPAQRIQATLATMTVTQQQEAAQTDAWETGGSPMRESDTLGCMVMFYHHVWQEPAFQVYAGLFLVSL